MKRKLLSLLLVCVMLVSVISLFTSCDEEKPTYSKYVKLEVAGYGDIVIELYKTKAPATVYNFQQLVANKFYDGLIFHRVVEGFMIQGGCPNGDGTGNAGYNIQGEMMSNGFSQNTIKHERGVVSMARSASGYNTGSCQFFIMTEDNFNLDGEYAAFGRVIEGMDVVDAIAKTATDGSETDSYGVPVGGKPVQDVVITSATFLTKN